MIPDSAEFRKLNAKLNKIGQKLAETAISIPDKVKRELALGANEIRNTIIMSMKETPKTGKHYRRGKSGLAHIASSPGNPPAIDYGELVRSIMFDVRPMEIEVGSVGGAPYSVYLEGGVDWGEGLGGMTGRRMEPRPFLGPAVRKHEESIADKVGGIAFETIQQGFKSL